jgi:hypothetical protein
VQEARAQAAGAVERVAQAEEALKKVETQIAEAQEKLEATHKALTLTKMRKIGELNEDTAKKKADIKQTIINAKQARKDQVIRIIQLQKDLAQHKEDHLLAERRQLKDAKERSKQADLALPAETAMLAQVVSATMRITNARTKSLEALTKEVEAAVGDFTSSTQQAEQLAKAVQQAEEELKTKEAQEEELFKQRPIKPQEQMAVVLADKAAQVKQAHAALKRAQEEAVLAQGKAAALKSHLAATVEAIVKRAEHSAESQALAMQPDDSTSANWIMHSEPNSTVAKAQEELAELRKETIELRRQAAAVLHNASKTANMRDGIVEHQIQAYNRSLQQARANKVKAIEHGVSRRAEAEAEAVQVVDEAEDKAQELLSAALGVNNSLAQTSEAAASCKILVADCSKNGTSAVHFPHLFSKPGLFTAEEQPSCLARAQELHSRCGANSAALSQVMHKILLRFDPSLDRPADAENTTQAVEMRALMEDAEHLAIELD